MGRSVGVGSGRSADASVSRASPTMSSTPLSRVAHEGVPAQPRQRLVARSPLTATAHERRASLDAAFIDWLKAGPALASEGQERTGESGEDVAIASAPFSGASRGSSRDKTRGAAHHVDMVAGLVPQCDPPLSAPEESAESDGGGSNKLRRNLSRSRSGSARKRERASPGGATSTESDLSTASPATKSSSLRRRHKPALSLSVQPSSSREHHRHFMAFVAPKTPVTARPTRANVSSPFGSHDEPPTSPESHLKQKRLKSKASMVMGKILGKPKAILGAHEVDAFGDPVVIPPVPSSPPLAPSVTTSFGSIGSLTSFSRSSEDISRQRAPACADGRPATSDGGRRRERTTSEHVGLGRPFSPTRSAASLSPRIEPLRSLTTRALATVASSSESSLPKEGPASAAAPGSARSSLRSQPLALPSPATPPRRRVTPRGEAPGVSKPDYPSLSPPPRRRKAATSTSPSETSAAADAVSVSRLSIGDGATSPSVPPPRVVSVDLFQASSTPEQHQARRPASSMSSSSLSIMDSQQDSGPTSASHYGVASMSFSDVSSSSRLSLLQDIKARESVDRSSVCSVESQQSAQRRP